MPSARKYVEKVGSEIDQARGSRLWRDSVNMLNTVAESVFSRSAHFILELLQNAEDAGPKNCRPDGRIEFVISESRIQVSHNGTPFTEDNVDAICGVRSTKKPELGTLGFLGIGFKSVFKITDCPQVHSADFHFKFDKSAHADPAEVPWQIMPIWVDDAPDRINSDLTTFILPFRSASFYEQTREELKKLDVHVFLFLKWLRQLKVVDECDGHTVVIENLGGRGGFVTLKKNETEQRFVIERRSVTVPPEVAADPVLAFYKRQSVTQREVVVAFAVDKDENLQSAEGASALGSVSSFLPLVEERSGAKFLIQADFLVLPGREAIAYELAWNRWLVGEAVEAAKQAAERFKAHPRWGRQFLALFSFKSYADQPAFEKLFSPKLKVPLLEYLRTSDVVATVSGAYVRPELAVFPENGLQGLLADADLPLLFFGRTGLRLADPSMEAKSLPLELQQAVQRVELGQVARNKKLLESRVGQQQWLQKFYEAMAETHRAFKETQRQGRRGRIEWVEDPIYVPTESGEVLRAKGVHLRKIPSEVGELRTNYPEVDILLRGYKLLHACLDTEELNKFFAERSHVQAIDYDKICREVFLPKVQGGCASASERRIDCLHAPAAKGYLEWMSRSIFWPRKATSSRQTRSSWASPILLRRTGRSTPSIRPNSRLSARPICMGFRPKTVLLGRISSPRLESRTQESAITLRRSRWHLWRKSSETSYPTSCRRTGCKLATTGKQDGDVTEHLLSSRSRARKRSRGWSSSARSRKPQKLHHKTTSRSGFVSFPGHPRNRNSGLSKMS